MAELTNKVVAEVRTSFGKGAARKIRAQNKIPAVLYGHGTDPVHVTLPGHQILLLTRKANAILELDIEGVAQTSLVKDIQRDPVRQIIEHIDLAVIRLGEKVSVDIPVHVEGEAAPGTLVSTEANTLSLEVDATKIPQNVVVSVEGLEAGTQITAADVTLPEGATLLTDPEALIVNVTEEVEQDLGEEGEPTEPAEPTEAAE
ncbi:50S ribosomal protein L25/general stress protein Ctc [Rathayibacter sp. VKM Ac-2856]|uniref:50S ribosomal protein L25/general stress protein Ctc n=1 Tax=unclassified Rathayibacter TaxID=2609250 RepID=UPI0013190A2A|nr:MULTISPECIES: 50S ribosomal protein L25/general stress protein Ctc [unclassified Rathayibacter]NQX06423.1 50S ribosomal protein L25/general stress protein Ctc [Rathayibacter sp. VKM Ac-2858]NQX21590.1 50S ribosomal protein L25/general stress protein Ctc [Rathayibacter sp. VKM Ac-2856]QHC58093.1 50S ribosomal protein L25/general stress protein Ctc [Rathayibacter sp. VKM Ac-2760]